MPVIRVFDDTRGKGRCRSCDTPITWFRTVAGKAVPMDGHEPVPVQSEHNEDMRLVSVFDSADTHWATCPDAKTWKRGA
jgi:hypothetical protein